MKSTRFILMMFGLLLSCFTFGSTAKADGARSYISPSGSDNRPCTRNQPCRTFDGAMTKTDEGGEIVALETSVYDPTTVTKSITLTAAPGVDALIKATSGNAVTISVPNGSTVVLRGLKLSGPGKLLAGNGVFVDQGDRCCIAVYVENCVISEFGTGLNMVVTTSGHLAVSDSVFRNNTWGLKFGTFGAESMGAAVTRTRFERNSIGVNSLSGRSIDIKDSVASSNGIGFLADSGSSMNISNSIITKNGVGIETKAFGIVSLGYSQVTGNGAGLNLEGVVRSMGNNMFAGNEFDAINEQNLITLLPK